MLHSSVPFHAFTRLYRVISFASRSERQAFVTFLWQQPQKLSHSIRSQTAFSRSSPLPHSALITVRQHIIQIFTSWTSRLVMVYAPKCCWATRTCYDCSSLTQRYKVLLTVVSKFFELQAQRCDMHTGFSFFRAFFLWNIWNCKSVKLFLMSNQYGGINFPTIIRLASRISLEAEPWAFISYNFPVRTASFFPLLLRFYCLFSSFHSSNSSLFEFL